MGHRNAEESQGSLEYTRTDIQACIACQPGKTQPHPNSSIPIRANQIEGPSTFIQGNGTHVFVELGRNSAAPANHTKGDACQNKAVDKSIGTST